MTTSDRLMGSDRLRVKVGIEFYSSLAYTVCQPSSRIKVASYCCIYPRVFHRSTSIGDFSEDPQSSFDTEAVHPSCPESLRPKAKRPLMVSTRECWAPPAVAIASRPFDKQTRKHRCTNTHEIRSAVRNENIKITERESLRKRFLGCYVIVSVLCFCIPTTDRSGGVCPAGGRGKKAY